ncbi:MAG: ABC transporter ATP-binding protein [Thermoplasmatota archaeon]
MTYLGEDRETGGPMAGHANGGSGSVVEARALGKRYGAQWAARRLSFSVRAGEVFGLIGPNGAGKTTTLKMLAGLVAPSEGEALVLGQPTSDPKHRARIGYLPEESALYEDLTPVAYLRFFASLYGVPRALAETRIASTLTLLELDGSTRAARGKKIGDLSKGNKRKVALARALVNDPALLLFDEPASGLDPVIANATLELVGALARAGKTVIFSAHNLYHVERICDRVLILRAGETVALGTMAEIRAAAGGFEYRIRVSVPLPGAEPAATGEGFEIVVDDLASVGGIERAAKEAGGRVLDVRSTELPLEEIFLKAAAGQRA